MKAFLWIHRRRRRRRRLLPRTQQERGFIYLDKSSMAGGDAGVLTFQDRLGGVGLPNHSSLRRFSKVGVGFHLRAVGDFVGLAPPGLRRVAS